MQPPMFLNTIESVTYDQDPDEAYTPAIPVLAVMANLHLLPPSSSHESVGRPHSR